ncbi:MAG TPA: DNA double-strand break repair nuclease NurA, partial [Dehalococcoidia bacterium]|nr:DNA double-strand break repair nuclease NurA [Dehalococcoidia bacterium]
DSVYGVLDRDLFANLLDYGERSAVFQIHSRNIIDEYRDHATCFFYLHVGNEVARVEIPLWLARQPDRVRLVHQLVLDQVERGLGYPAALVEAHERAVVRGADRDEFTHLIERELNDARLRLPSSEKHVSKRLRAL